ncbi:Xanthine/uracil/vitamin C permease [Thermaerobacter marianensis DSM 12885]|uniref:Xanthine/uracil/vitamin C permease n=1 Tax=Thermaerobacter marianensis (strain ATCC 700841 / DSM 12885 / JCM 10246 / 7p75a) TaxID=644966 RepID=E6SGD4_THEM7|nr:solute carrier family 23 protein [Thermaerobacter marianensis]ADU51586.1 Xanthine/uracil/vitamin C permease [Thermaerobacter marianensis DSM 12885]
MAAERDRIIGYLPQDRPPFGALVSLGFQHVLTMFPATVLVAILTGFDVGVTLFASGLATIVAVLGSGGRIPLYYGGSFAYIAPVKAVASASWGGLQVAQVGVVATGVLNAICGWLIQRAGKARLDRVLPPAVTGSVAIVIGIALAKAAMDMAAKNWSIALITLLLTILFSVYLQGRGLLGMLPVLLGATCGYLIAAATGHVNFAPVREAPWFAIPKFQLPAFTAPGAWQAVLAIAPIAIATIPESTAHLYQISLYIDRLAEEMKRPPLRIKELIGLNLILDGLADMVHGLLGASSGTNYGENNSLMAITRNYSTAVLVAAGVIAMILGFFSKLSALVGTIPEFVTGGLAIYLFGVIGMQGIALMMSERVNLFDPRQLAIGAVILVIGLGGNAFEGGNIPIWGLHLPAIATAAVAGILLNLVFLAFDRNRAADREQGVPSGPAPAPAGGDD